jgi:hypothetical protein
MHFSEVAGAGKFLQMLKLDSDWKVAIATHAFTTIIAEMVVATNSSCVFRKIIAGNLPVSQLYSDELCTAFLDLHPINPEHMSD